MSRWTLGRGILFSTGAAVVVISLLVLVGFAYLKAQLNTRRPDLTRPEFQWDITSISPSQSWELWSNVFRDEPLRRQVLPPHLVNQQTAARFTTYMLMSGGFAVVGSACAAAALLLRPRPD